MKVLITTSKHIASYQLASLLKNEELIFGDYFTDYPTDASNSIAHQILKFCLDHQVKKVFPLAFAEVEELKKSLVLFDEFGIEIMLSIKERQDVAIADKQVNSFSELSTGLIALGYPNLKIAIGDKNGRGDLILIDDVVKDNSQIWNQVKSMNFTQIGKWFNQANFAAVSLYKLNDGEFSQAFVLIDGGGLRSVQNLPPSMVQMLQNTIATKNLKGFYHVAFAEEKIIRMVNATL